MQVERKARKQKPQQTVIKALGRGVEGVEGVGDRGIDFGMPSVERSRDSEASLDTWSRAERERRSQTWDRAHGGGGG